MRCLILFIFSISICFGFEAKVICVIDGDTISVATNTNEFKVRLWGVDAPERGQDFGKEATDYLSGLISGKKVEIKSLGEDPYHRMVAVIYMYSNLINENMVKNGYAWTYFMDNKHPEYQLKWKTWEAQAKIERVGLWGQKNPIRPYDFRKKFLRQQYNVTD